MSRIKIADLGVGMRRPLLSMYFGRTIPHSHRISRHKQLKKRHLCWYAIVIYLERRVSTIEITATRPRISVIRQEAALPQWLTKQSLARFLHESMKPYEDKLSDIEKALAYVFDDKATPGGFIVLATNANELLGATVIHYTPWAGYVPENLLLFIAVHPDHRGQGLGRALIEEALANCDGDMKLHVEYDNPAKRLYERIGFTSKYAEMRYAR